MSSIVSVFRDAKITIYFIKGRPQTKSRRVFRRGENEIDGFYCCAHGFQRITASGVLAEALLKSCGAVWRYQYLHLSAEVGDGV